VVFGNCCEEVDVGGERAGEGIGGFGDYGFCIGVGGGVLNGVGHGLDDSVDFRWDPFDKKGSQQYA
jgi:hypothetical protein